MRVWEVDDAKSLPGDMVQEQDFVMRLRAMHRQTSPYLIVNATFAALPALQSDLALKEQLQRQLEDAAKQCGGVTHTMSNGDYFVSVPLTNKNPRGKLMGLMTQACLPVGASEDDAVKLVHGYELPADYMKARERANHYIESARAAAQIGRANESPEVALQNDTVRGPLTAWSLNQITQLFEEIDVRRYVRSQNVYRHTGADWSVIGAEYFVSIEDLKRERFPRLDIHQPERLFMEVCSALDRRLLNQLADAPESLAGGPLFLNVAVESVLNAPFAKFVKTVPVDRRKQITFEINRGDLLLNLSMTLNAMELLRQEGFKVAFDGLHPDLLLYMRLEKFAADFYKIRVSKDRLERVKSPEVQTALHALPADKVIFYRCDNDDALAIGRAFGVTMFQGWLIDDLAHPHKADDPVK